MSAHSSLGASSSHRWLACPGSVRLSKGLVSKGSVYADEGTAAHELASRCLLSDGLDPSVFLDTIIQTSDMDSPVQVTEEMVEAVLVYVDYVHGRMAEGYELIGIEQQFDLAPLNPPAPMWGRADAVLFLPARSPMRMWDGSGISLPKPSVLEVADLKYGSGTVVEPEQNSQGMYYAIGAVLATKKRADTVRITIAQPRAPHSGGIVRSWECSWDELVAFREELLSGAVATQQDDAPLFAGSHCKFCPALAICPAQAEAAQAAAKTVFTQVPVTNELVPEPGEVQLPVPATLTLEELGRVMEAAGPLADWLKAVMNHMRDLTEAGVKTGYKLVPKRGRRLWKNETEAEQVLRDSLGDDEAFTRKLLSVTQAEKAARVAGYEKVDAELWAMVSSGTNLVPDSDPREAITPLPTAQDVFEPVTLIPAEDIHVEPEVVEVEFEDGSRETRLVGLTAEEIEGMKTQPIAEVSAFVVSPIFDEGVEKVVPNALTPGEIISEGEEITEPIEPEVVEYSVAQEEYTPNEEEVQLWQVRVPNAEEFYVQAPNEAEAKAMARDELKVERLPNHTTVSLS